jgi:serine phosphatase RsbU (regulator of sigma subunit)
MSMLGTSGFNQVLSNTDCGRQSGEFLNLMRDFVKTALHYSGEGDAVDGMDVALCIINKENLQISFSGANNPMYLVRDGELLEYKGDKMPIGWHTKDKNPFNQQVIEGRKGDCIYLFSDGYADQFGGERGKKFMYKRFKSLLLEIHQKPVQDQLGILDKELEDWKGTMEQVDDIMVMGIRL